MFRSNNHLFVVFSVLVSASAWCTDARSQEPCRCSGDPIQTYNGGDSSPLNWRYGAYLMSPGDKASEKVVCYEKSVENTSDTEIRDISWKVAGFKRTYIPALTKKSSCPPVAGETKSAPTNGSLHFGVSSDKYDTTVLEPADGWVSDELASSVAYKSSFETAFSVDWLNNDGQHLSTMLSFRSNIFPSEKDSILEYLISNNGSAKASVLINLHATPDSRKDLPFIEKPVDIDANKSVRFQSKVGGVISVKPSSIIVYDENGDITAIETAAFFVPSDGKKVQSDQLFWD